MGSICCPPTNNSMIQRRTILAGVYNLEEEKALCRAEKISNFNGVTASKFVPELKKLYLQYQKLLPSDFEKLGKQFNLNLVDWLDKSGGLGKFYDSLTMDSELSYIKVAFAGILYGHSTNIIKASLLFDELEQNNVITIDKFQTAMRLIFDLSTTSISHLLELQ